MGNAERSGDFICSTGLMRVERRSTALIHSYIFVYIGNILQKNTVGSQGQSYVVDYADLQPRSTYTSKKYRI